MAKEAFLSLMFMTPINIVMINTVYVFVCFCFKSLRVTLLELKWVNVCLYFVFSVVVILDEVKYKVEDIFGTEVLDISE